MFSILIVDDEKAIANLIDLSLRAAGYETTMAFDGEQAANLIEHEKFDLIILDIMLPKIDGYELISYINEFNIPVIFLTAKDTVYNKVKGLRLGADDYMTKPFDPVELLARIETVLRRYHKNIEKFQLGDIDVDTESRVVRRNGKEILLTTKEFDLLVLFIKNRNIALNRETIYQRVWECEFMDDTRTVDLHVQRLRKKMSWEKSMRTIYKVGYRLEI